MKLGIIGLPESGKTTLFEALTGQRLDPPNKSENRQGMIRVPDFRVDELSRMYQPKKTTYTQVEYFLPGVIPGKKDSKDPAVWTLVRDCDALILVLRNFSGYGNQKPDPRTDFLNIDSELMLSDQITVEKRIERMEADKKRGKKMDSDEMAALTACLRLLESETPIRRDRSLAESPHLRGFALMSAKPMLVLFNNADDDDIPPDDPVFSVEEKLVIKAKLEQEISRMSSEEAALFLSEFNLTATATDRVIRCSYELLGLISFFTVGEDEVKAWTIRRSTEALEAAGVIHSDIKKGFIRAEVLHYDHLMEAKTYAEARKRGTVRLEGKTYPVQDGDIIHFRFNV
jgi:GTP-binding protein YchF